MREIDSVKITTVVDNDVWKKGLSSAWGLSFHVEALKDNVKHAILMDTSGSFEAFYKNALKLDVNLTAIKGIFISHWHGDHCGALSQVLSLLKPETMVYVPSENSFGLREIKGAGGIPWICHKPSEFVDGIMSTGEVLGRLSEHSLLVNVKNKGLVVSVGCSHPGIINILKRAQKVSGVNKIFAVIGGFHISSFTEGIAVGKFLREIDVEFVSPCHCTSIDAKHGIAKIMGERYIKNGSGKIISTA